MEKEKNIEFEGEYLDGKKWNGEGMEINDNGQVEFEGKYLNGKRWEGNITEYDFDSGEIISIEEMVNGIIV